MTAVVPGLIAIAAYLACALRQTLTLQGQKPPARSLVLVMALFAVINHAFFVSALMWTPQGIDLSLLRVGSLVFLLMCTLLLLSGLLQPMENLFAPVFPLAALSILLALLTGPGDAPRNDLSGGLVAHILLSLLAYSVLIISLFQAGLLASQDRALRMHHTHSLIQVLPPLQTMEQLLFSLLWTGFLLLSASLLTGWLYMEDMLAQHVAHKTVFSVLSWLVFATLLGGRYLFGWRGERAVRWTLGGGALLLLAYFGSKLVLEIILQR